MSERSGEVRVGTFACGYSSTPTRPAAVQSERRVLPSLLVVVDSVSGSEFC
jgi:hypothetical protein